VAELPRLCLQALDGVAWNSAMSWKLAVDGGEAHVGHLVELRRLVHDQLADCARVDLALAGGAQLVP
jgi:hypothetical protein